jgi:hypothetical protein
MYTQVILTGPANTVDRHDHKISDRAWNFRSVDHRNSLGQWIFGGRVEVTGWAG